MQWSGWIQDMRVFYRIISLWDYNLQQGFPMYNMKLLLNTAHTKAYGPCKCMSELWVETSLCFWIRAWGQTEEHESLCWRFTSAQSKQARVSWDRWQQGRLWGLSFQSPREHAVCAGLEKQTINKVYMSVYLSCIWAGVQQAFCLAEHLYVPLPTAEPRGFQDTNSYQCVQLWH